MTRISDILPTWTRQDHEMSKLHHTQTAGGTLCFKAKTLTWIHIWRGADEVVELMKLCCWSRVCMIWELTGPAAQGNVSLKNVKGFSFTEEHNRSREMSMCKHIKRLRFISRVHASRCADRRMICTCTGTLALRHASKTNTHTPTASVNDLLSNHYFWVSSKMAFSWISQTLKLLFFA